MKNKKIKALFVVVPAAVLVLFLLNSFALKQKEAVEKTNIAIEKTNILFKSVDGGQTWQDISQGLPEIAPPVRFFAGDSDMYIHVKNVMYRSKSDLKTPVWEKENIPDLQNASPKYYTSIVSNRSGVIAFNNKGQIYQKTPASKTWLPVYTNFNKDPARIIFETANGTMFLGFDRGLYRSTDKGKNWKEVQRGSVHNLVASEGVLFVMVQRQLFRSTDNGEHWQQARIGTDLTINVEPIKGGFAATTYDNATSSKRIRTSLDGGKTWQINSTLPRSLYTSSIKQLGKYLIYASQDGIFRSADMGKTWDKVHPGADESEFKFALWDGTPNKPKKIFSLYVSGNVLYAVAGIPGC